MLMEVKEGVQWMLVKFFTRKAAWLKFTAVNTDCPTPKTSRSVIHESKMSKTVPHLKSTKECRLKVSQWRIPPDLRTNPKRDHVQNTSPHPPGSSIFYIRVKYTTPYIFHLFGTTTTFHMK